nr:DNA-directed DNA polymerase [Tanacetum cinerariifolium]
MADNRTMEKMLQAPTEGYEDAIVVPDILAENFEIRTGLLSLIQANQFHGFESNNPHDHIRSFNRITLNLKTTSVNLEMGEGIVSKFVNHFFPPSKTTHLKNEITRFTQKFEETFGEAWERFKEMLRQCPHHGFSELHQINTFYNGLKEHEQDSLNVAAGGNLLRKTPQDALIIIENKSKVRYSQNKLVAFKASPTSSGNSSSTDARIDKLTDTISNLVETFNKRMTTPATVRAVEETCVIYGGAHPYYDCIATDNNILSVCATTGTYNQGSIGLRPQVATNYLASPLGFPPVQNNKNHYNQNQNQSCNQNRGYNYQAPIQHPQVGLTNEFSKYKQITETSIRAMQNQIDNFKAGLKNEIHSSIQNQINSVKNELRSDISNQTNELRNMMASYFQMNTASSSGSGLLPSNTVPNPRADLKAITTRSGVTLDGPSVSLSSKEVNREPETITNQELTESTNNVPPPVVQPSLISTSFSTISFSKMPRVTKDTVQPSTKNIQPLVAQIQVPIDEPVVAPKPKLTIPYPSRANKQKLCEKDGILALKFVEIFRNLHFELSFADALLHMPKFALMFKSFLNKKEKSFDLATTPVNENCSAVILKKVPEKLGDPGKFSYHRKLSLPELTSTQMILELADRSTTRLAGITEDVFVKVGKFHFPTNFVVVDYVVDPRVPLILGRPFLRTERALIDVYDEELTLYVDDEAITFKVGQTSKYSYNNAELINRIDVACEEYVQEVLGFFDNFKNGSPTPASNPIIPSSSTSFTPFEGSYFILEEIDTFLQTLDELSDLDDDYYNTEGDILYLEKLLNEDPSLNLPPVETGDLKQVDATMTKPSIEEPPELELKELPSHLEYAFLEGADKLPVIISKKLKDEEKSAFLKVLKSHKRAITWKIFDIKGIDPHFYTHKILMEDDFKPAVQHQRRVNPKNHEVIKKEVIKLLDAGLIYPISDSPWVSPVHCVPKKGGMTVVENEDNELLPTRSRLTHKTKKRLPSLPLMEHLPTDVCLLVYVMLLARSKDKMLQRCDDPNLVLNWEKCYFMVKEGIVLGHKISKSEIKVDGAKVDVIAKLPHPTSVKVRAVLGQQNTKHFQPIHYASKTMTKAQAHYTTTKKELLAVVYAFENFRPYLVLSKTIVYTDHSAFKYLLAKLDAKPRLIRWIFLLQEFDVIIHDKKGAENLAADHFFRLENPHQDELEKKEITETFHLETLGMIAFRGDSSTPWFSDFANYHEGQSLANHAWETINGQDDVLREQSRMDGYDYKLRTLLEDLEGHDVSADFITEADPGLSAPNDSIPPQQGMDEGTKNTSYDHISLEKGASSTAIHSDKEEASSTIKLEDLAKLVSQIQPSVNDLDSPEDDTVIIVDESDKDEPNAETKEPSVPRSSSPSSLPTELKDLPSKFNELSDEVKGLKTQVHELGIELPKELKEILTTLEAFMTTVTSLTSQVDELKTLHWELPEEFLSLPAQDPITFKVYREDGTNEVISNFKASDLHLGEWREVVKACPNRKGKGWKTIYGQIGKRIDYLHSTEAELGINLDIPLSMQDPLDKLNDLSNKKRKHVDDIHDRFKANKRLKSSVQYEDHSPGTVHNEPILGYCELDGSSNIDQEKRFGPNVEGTTREYVALFEKLACQLVGVSKEVVEATFIKGLKTDLRAARVGVNNRSSSYRYNSAAGSGFNRNSILSSTQSVAPKGSVSASSTATKGGSMTRSGQFKRLTKAELADKRRKVDDNDIEEKAEEEASRDEDNHVHLDMVERLVDQLGLEVTGSKIVRVILGNGKVEKSQGICKGVLVTFLEMQILVDFFPFEFGSTDVTLGIKWLETLGDMSVNWKNLTRSFGEGTNRVMIQGFMIEVKRLENVPTATSIITTEIQALIDKYDDVFCLPRGLPPNQDHEHDIVLQNGTKPKRKALLIPPHSKKCDRKISEGGSKSGLYNDNQEKDKIGSKPGKNEKRGEAGRSQKQLQSREQEKLKKMQVEGPKMQTPTKFY